MGFRAFLFLLAALLAPQARACTAFSFRSEGGKRYFAKSFDWKDGGLILNLNGRGAARVGEGGHAWVAGQQSITFHLDDALTKGLPLGGINEAGLALEVLLCLETRAVPNAAPAPVSLDQLEWVQYQLDRSKSVEDVVASLKEVAPKLHEKLPLHFFGCDPKGCFVLEVVNGQVQVHRKEDLAFEALANSAYAKSVAHARSGAAAGNPKGSLSRFGAGARAAADHVKDPVAHAEASLEEVRLPTTQWQAVYNLDDRTVEVRTKEMGKFRRFSLADVKDRNASRTLFRPGQTVVPCAELYEQLLRP